MRRVTEPVLSPARPERPVGEAVCRPRGSIQVLESLAKYGAPTRAEVTDAAWSIRAECVMLNKGPYIAETISFLDDVLGRMTAHRSKRTPMLRRLSVAASAWSRSVAPPDETG